MVDVGHDEANQSTNADPVQRPPGFEELRKGMGNLDNPVGVTTERGDDIVHHIQDLIRSHPISSILTALGLGFLLGLFRGGRR